MPAGVLAHGLGGRLDLPVPLWQVTWGAAVVLVVSFALLGITWRRAHLVRMSRGRAMPEALDKVAAGVAWPLRLTALALFLITLTAGLFGADDSSRNLAPVTVYVVVWVAVPIGQALVGDLWRVLNPYETLAILVDRRRSEPDRLVEVPSRWVAVAGPLGFVWLDFPTTDRPRLERWLCSSSPTRS